MRQPAPRRALLSGAVLAAAGLAAPAAAQRASDRSRAIWLRNGAGEEVRASYVRADGQIDWPVVARLRHLFRDLRQNAAGPMPVMLLDTLGTIQARWRDRPLILLSGFRTPRTNSALEGAAQNSRHLEGQAADILLPGVPIAQIAAAAAALSYTNRILGVGTYAGFVHVDIGPERGWRGRAPA